MNFNIWPDVNARGIWSALVAVATSALAGWIALEWATKAPNGERLICGAVAFFIVSLWTVFISWVYYSLVIKATTKTTVENEKTIEVRND